MPQPTATAIALAAALTLGAPAAEQRSLPLQTRAVPVATVDADARTFETVWTTGARVRRYDWWTGTYYLEELSLDHAHVRLDRMNGGAPLLNSHQQWDLSSVLGITEKAWMEPTEGRSICRFSDRDDKVNAIWRDVVNKIVRHISVGYIVHRFMKLDAEVEGGLPIWKAIDWEPVEQSFVPIGADPLAGVRAMGEGADHTLEQLRELASRAVGGRSFPCEFVTRDAPQPALAANVSPNPAAAAVVTPTTPQERSMTPEELQAQAAAEAAATRAQAQAAAAATEAAVQAERTRSAAIRAAVGAFRRTVQGELITDAQVDAMIERGITVDAARAEMFGLLETRSNSTGPTRSAAAITTTQDEQVQRRADMSAAVAHRANPSVALPETARRFRGLSLLELARRGLELQGVNTEGMSRNALVSLAMGNSDEMGFRTMHGNSDFAIALTSTVNRSLRDAYTSANQTFKAWARKGTLSDFRAATRVAVAANLALEKVGELGEFKRGTISDAGEQIRLATYGKVVGVSRQAIINDDLDFLGRLPAMFGRAAADFESDTVYSVLKGNPVMADGVTLFHANHKNLGTGAGITEAALDEATQAMRKQTDFGGNAQPLNLTARHLIVSAAREVQARKLLSALVVPGKTGDVNIYANAYELVVEPRLDAVNPLEWFLAADSGQIDTIEYAYLEGEEGLYTEQRMGFDVDGLEVKARLDFAAKATDHRGLFKNPGA
ncbi:prohead protease/major capsid protein fusion protein [Roseateles sp. P5_E7]